MSLGCRGAYLRLVVERQLPRRPGRRDANMRLYTANSALRWSLLALAWLLTAPLARAQVVNDNIESRRVLQTEATVTSNTTGCTVQRRCVDERLTGKCIEYHNDQWF